jgi:hypothetical protein
MPGAAKLSGAIARPDSTLHWPRGSYHCRRPTSGHEEMPMTRSTRMIRLFLAGALFALLPVLCTPAFAHEGPRQRRDRLEDRWDRREDRRDRREDRADRREDRRDARRFTGRRDRIEDRRDRREDRADRREDRRDRREDRRDRRR